MQTILEWFLLYKLNIVLSIVILFIYFVLRRIVIPRIEQYVERDNFKSDVLKKAVTVLNFFSGALIVAVILFIWGFDFKGLLTISTGLIALTGVALFASWSILSNITAFFLLLSHQSYRKGNFIRIIDVDNYIEGYISEINLFHTKLIGENEEIVLYPNNLLISRPTIINAKTHYSMVGKTTDFSAK